MDTHALAQTEPESAVEGDPRVIYVHIKVTKPWPRASLINVIIVLTCLLPKLKILNGLTLFN